MKRALISTYYKEGIEKAARLLQQNKWEIISTGGTATYLKGKGIDVAEVSTLTQFPEILDGRVKTLHPLIFGPILAKKTPDHLAQLEEYNLAKIDLVMVNFYPFEDAMKETGRDLSYMVEKIDIGGPAMVRAAAKNFQHTVVVVSQEDYEPTVTKLIEEGDLDITLRQQLAQKAFAYTSFYDSLVAQYLGKRAFTAPAFFTLSGRKKANLRYGENPHQKAALYIRQPNSPFANFTQHWGKELSFNNILDASAVYETINMFTGKEFAVIVKHQNPCGAGLHQDQTLALKKALAGDPVSAFGGIIGFNNKVTAETAAEMKKIFLEVIVAPAYEKESLTLLKKKKDLRIIEIPLNYHESIDVKIIPGGMVVQEKDNLVVTYDAFTLKTSRRPSPAEIDDIAFGWKLIKIVKSNAIIIVKDGTLIGVGAGQMSRVDSVELAIKKSLTPLPGSCLISDAFFPFVDSIDRAAEKQIQVIVEPGGSVHDEEVIEKAEKNHQTLLFTGYRHFRH